LSAPGALLGGPLLGFGAGLLVVALLPERLRRVGRAWLLVAATACLVVGMVALEAMR
jgi:hypothetical protein